MDIVYWLRISFGVLFLLIGVHLFAAQVYGIFKFRYVLNRMHAAAMGDTLGIGSCLLGLMILGGFSFVTLKLGLIILFLWCSSPVASHLIARLQAVTDEDLSEHCNVSDEVQKKIELLAENKED